MQLERLWHFGMECQGLHSEKKIPEKRDQKSALSEVAARTALERCLKHFELQPRCVEAFAQAAGGE